MSAWVGSVSTSAFLEEALTNVAAAHHTGDLRHLHLGEQVHLIAEVNASR